MELPDPWYESADALLVDELHRETSPGHVLFGLPIQVLARRQDRDDVLYEIVDGSQRVAEVHLTWRSEAYPDWPAASVFANLEDWSRRMQCDPREDMV